MRLIALLVLLPLAVAQDNAELRKYADVAAWTGNISYSVQSTLNVTNGTRRETGEESERGLIVMHLDRFAVKTNTTVEWLGMGTTQAWRRSKYGSYTKDSTFETSKTVSALQQSEGWLLMDFRKGFFNASAKPTREPCEQRVYTKANLGERVKSEKTHWVPQTAHTVHQEPLPKPAPGMFLTGSKRDQDRVHVNVGGERWQLDFHALWTLAPVWGDIELVITVEDYDRWLPDGGRDGQAPGNTLTAHAELRSKDGKPLHLTARKIRFELLNTSKQPGVCVNWPPASKDDAFDLRFIPSTLSLPEDDKFQAVFAVGDKMTKASATVGCHDWGAWAELRATAELDDGRVIVGHLDGKPDLIHVPLPKRQPHLRVADAWKTANGRPVDEDDAWDEDPAPKPPTVKGDGLTLYEEYRGAFLKDGNHARLDPKQMELFVLDPDKLLDAGLWKKLTGSTAVPLTDDQHLAQRVNFHSDAKPKYALRIVKVNGVPDPEGTATETFVWGQTDESIADKPARARIFVDRPHNGLKNTFHVNVKKALADPQSPEGKLLYGDGLDKPMLEGADRALSDPAVLAKLSGRLVQYVVIHEVAHACDINHHAPDTFKGEKSCVMRNLDGHDKMYRMAGELTSPTSDPLPLGIDKLCTAGDDCWGHFRLKPK